MTRRLFALLLAPLSPRLFAQAAIAKENIVAADITERDGAIGVIDGRNGTFTLSYGPVGPASVKVYLNGMHQRQGADYTITGKLVTFSSVPPTGSTVDIDYRGYFG